MNDWGPTTESNANADADPWGSEPAPVEGELKPEQGRGRKDKEAEEEDNTLTLDQYLAQQKEKESAIPKLEGIRKANEGADDIWRGAVPLSKNEGEGSYYVGKACTFYIGYSYRISLQSCRQKVPRRLVPRRKKRSTSRSKLVSIVRSVVAVVDVAIVAIVDVATVATVVTVDVVTVSEDMGVVVVAESLDARIPTDLLLLSMSMTKPPSLLWLEQ